MSQLNNTGMLEMMRGTPPPTWEQTCIKLSEEKRELQERIKELEEDVKSYKVRLIEDGERIFTLGTRYDNYRAELFKARERIKHLELKEDELNDLKKWLEGR